MAKMRANLEWRTLKGTRTSDNRDFAGIGINAHGLLMIITDGSTAGESNGDLARVLVKEMVDWFAAASPVSAEVLCDFLRDLHSDLAPRFPRGSASYLVVICGVEGCFAAYAGDCSLGIRGADGSVSWITAPHTLANAVKDLPHAEIAKSKARHLLTSSFRSREFIAPTIEKFEGTASRLIMATDGFWAELSPDQQTTFLHTGSRTTSAEQDDCSALLISLAQTENVDEIHLKEGGSDGLYIRRLD